jgi:mercuric ion binding protein
MKKPLLALGAPVLFILASEGWATPQTVTLAVDNMYCALCPATVRKAIEAVDGVASVEVSFDRKEAVVTFEDTRTSWRAVASSSTSAGYPARLKDPR